ncbi:TetR/AcrR family transcriptional regulator [Paramicrobacterium chengjingii]|uniref:TetR family transcriptional regulator n=1 Tax=Paramicrobacterium chengjingii TaxID=2769067 RepID=A0ABX6YH43_9MICO|nr:TetR/AcrR family transcriptional regulator [Microbacterium chengjingii]QPZ38113.1 TetR family transcriptional regulator [Microbacterium chengjingii]
MPRTPVDVRRAELIAATLRVVSARGLGAASIRTIVAEAGMSLASFHYAFSSRDELLDTLIADVLEKEERAVLPEQLSGKELSELLEEGLLGYFDHLRTDPQYELAMLELTQFALRTRPRMAEAQYAEYARIAGASLELAATHTGCRWTLPVPDAAKMLVAFTDGLTLGWLVDRDDEAARTMIHAIAQSLAALAVPVAPGGAAR